MRLSCLLILVCIVLPLTSLAQQDASHDRDTFFLAKKKGLLGKLGRSITRNSYPQEAPAKVALPYDTLMGKRIHSIEIMPLAFNRNIYDTTYVRKNIGISIANALHKNSRERLIRRNLFFKEGDVFYPLLVSDNERFLRDQSYIQDALILAFESPVEPGMVDVIVITKDVFSLGGSISASGVDKARFEVSEDNLGGHGTRLALRGFYDKDRQPGYGVGAELVRRSMRKRKTLLNWRTGFTTFNPAIVNGRREENNVYTVIEKPFITRYTEWTGALSLAYHMTSNAYSPDSVYKAFARYRYVDADLWIGYNVGFGRKKSTDNEKRIRHFIAGRGFYTHFGQIPQKYQTEYNFNYANINGFLLQYNIYRQNFYKTKFIYGFGRFEDLPVGFHAGVTTGWTNKEGARRWYYGIEGEGSFYAKKGMYNMYTFRLGGFKPSLGKFQDMSLLFNVDHFTRLRWINSHWLNRNFITLNYSKRINPLLNPPLLLQSDFALPYVRGLFRPSDERTTIKLESVFFNTNKILGFRMAPFVFTDVSFLRPQGEPFKKTTGYSALGGGIRTRNENLVFGTIELRGYYFPRVEPGTDNWKVEFSTNVRFRYNTNFIRRPDFVLFN